MPEIRSDDKARQLRLVYLGPRGHTLGFEWTYTKLIVCFILGNLGVVLVFLPFYLLSGFWSAITWAIPFGLPAGIFTGVWLMKKVSHDEPLGYKLGTYWHLLTRQGRPAPDRPQRFNIAMPPITALPTTTKEPTRVLPEANEESPTRDEDPEEEYAPRRAWVE